MKTLQESILGSQEDIIKSTEIASTTPENIAATVRSMFADLGWKIYNGLPSYDAVILSKGVLKLVFKFAEHQDNTYGVLRLVKPANYYSINAKSDTAVSVGHLKHYFILPGPSVQLPYMAVRKLGVEEDAVVYGNVVDIKLLKNILKLANWCTKNRSKFDVKQISRKQFDDLCDDMLKEIHKINSTN